MATSVTLQSVITSPFSRTRFTNTAFPSKYVPRLQRNAKMQVRCKLEEEGKDDLVSQLTPNSSPKEGDKDILESPMSRLTPPSSIEGGNMSESPLSRLTPPPLKEISPRFIDVLAFTGPGPERINGRLAMVGFISAMVVEITRGQDLFTQIENGGYRWFLLTSVVLTMASLFPFSRGIGPGATTDKFWNPDAEVWNGRAAMVGLVALAITEYIKGGALV